MQLTLHLRDKASSLELLNWNMGVSRKEDHIPIIVTHDRRVIAAVQIQESNEQPVVVLERECVRQGEEPD